MTEALEVRPGGVLPVDKPVGLTSHQVVARARKALGTRRIGHAGTLDPFASGLLLLCVDAATRLAQYLTGLDKTYEATLVLGERTDTLDPEGEVVERDDAWRSLGTDEIRAALTGFVGEIRQVPPQYSAKKVQGEAMYRKARRGERVELEAVPLHIREMELLTVDLPRVRFRTRCSSGTYVRALARDLGTALGTCGHLRKLRRTAVGTFDVEGAISVHDLDDATGVGASWISPLEAVRHLPSIRVDAGEARRLAHGQALERWTVETPPGSGIGDGGGEGAAAGEAGELGKAIGRADGLATEAEGVPLAVEWNGNLVAVGERRGRSLEPRKVFVRV